MSINPFFLELTFDIGKVCSVLLFCVGRPVLMSDVMLQVGVSES